MPRAMGIDLGDKRMGVALSDELGLTAQGLEVLERLGREKDLAALRRIVVEHEVNRLVVGLPLNMDGSEGPRARAARAFAELAERELGVPCTLWDERLTTVAAERVLIEADLSRRRRREVVDKLAAQLILQGFLDASAARAAPGDAP